MTPRSASDGARFRFAELVGSYRLVVSDALLEFIERAFVDAAPPDERARVREAALEEARQAELHVDLDGTVISRAGNVEFYRVKVHVDDGEIEALHFEKAKAMPVTLVLASPHRLIAHQPNKPPAEFRRVDAGSKESKPSD